LNLGIKDEFKMNLKLKFQVYLRGGGFRSYQGCVARDAEGGFLLATTRRLPDVSPAPSAEGEALLAGVHLIHTVTTGPVIVETD
jgi:hypothetical protein